MNNEHEHERQAGESETEYECRVANAWKAGRKVQCQAYRKGEWADLEPWKHGKYLYWQHNYRIAPGQQEPAKPFVGLDLASGPDRTVFAEVAPKQEPAKAREWWVSPPTCKQDLGRCLDYAPQHESSLAKPFVHVREVLPGDDVEALRADNLLVRLENSKLMDRIDELAGRAQQAESEAETLRAERDAAIEARDNALSAVRDMRLELNAAIESRDKMEVALRDMRAELDKVNAERDELLTTRSNQYATLRMHLEAFNSVNAELTATKAERDEYRNDLLESERRRDKLRNELNVAEAVIRISSHAPEQLQAEIAELKAAKEATGRVHEMHGKAVLDLLAAKDRIIALQDELATVRNECATLAAKLTEAVSNAAAIYVPSKGPHDDVMDAMRFAPNMTEGKK